MPIAYGSSHGPDFVNLQLGLWRHALTQFHALQEAGEGGTQSLLSTPLYDEWEYSENEFAPDAAVAIVLAGTSLSQLLGQNTGVRRNDGDIPGFWPCVKDVLGLSKDQTPPDFQEFFDLYECLKHFGEPHHDIVADLSPEGLCKYMRAAQDFWVRVLNHLQMPVPDELFANEFTMEWEEDVELNGSSESADP